jgi:hypothetical protein
MVSDEVEDDLKDWSLLCESSLRKVWDNESDERWNVYLDNSEVKDAILKIQKIAKGEKDLEEGRFVKGDTSMSNDELDLILTKEDEKDIIAGKEDYKKGLTRKL